MDWSDTNFMCANMQERTLCLCKLQFKMSCWLDFNILCVLQLLNKLSPQSWDRQPLLSKPSWGHFLKEKGRQSLLQRPDMWQTALLIDMQLICVKHIILLDMAMQQHDLLGSVYASCLYRIWLLSLCITLFLNWFRLLSFAEHTALLLNLQSSFLDEA